MAFFIEPALNVLVAAVPENAANIYNVQDSSVWSSIIRHTSQLVDLPGSGHET